MSSGTPFLVMKRSTLLVVPRLATTFLSAATPASTELPLFLFLLTDEGLKFLEKTGSSALSVSKRTVEFVLGTCQCVLSLTSQSELLLRIEFHYIERSENNGVDEIPSTGLEPTILTLGGSRLILLGYED